MQPRIIEPLRGDGKLAEHITPEIKRVLCVFWHGTGDICLYRVCHAALVAQFPEVHFDVALARGLQQEKIIPDAVLVDGDWREQVPSMDYDLVCVVNFPMEHSLEHTKAEECCFLELGVPPVSGHLPLRPKPLVATHFHITCLPEAGNCPEPVARMVWEEIKEAGCIPVETYFEHVFSNPINKRFDFVTNHVRNWPADLDSCISLIGAAFAFIGSVSGNFHIALSCLPMERIMLLERAIKRPMLTKLPIKTADVMAYQPGTVKDWLLRLQRPQYPT